MTGTIAGIASIIAVIIHTSAAAVINRYADEIKKGSLAAPLFANLLCRLRSALTARMFRERLAPRERCVQLWFSSKPGGVMSPPELIELSSLDVLPREVICKRRMGEHTNSTGRALSSASSEFLLDEKSFSKLIPAHERFHRAESAEQVLYFAVLVDLLRGTQNGRGNNLQRV